MISKKDSEQPDGDKPEWHPFSVWKQQVFTAEQTRFNLNGHQGRRDADRAINVAHPSRPAIEAKI